MNGWSSWKKLLWMKNAEFKGFLKIFKILTLKHNYEQYINNDCIMNSFNKDRTANISISAFKYWNIDDLCFSWQQKIQIIIYLKRNHPRKVQSLLANKSLMNFKTQLHMVNINKSKVSIDTKNTIVHYLHYALFAFQKLPNISSFLSSDQLTWQKCIKKTIKIQKGRWITFKANGTSENE